MICNLLCLSGSSISPRGAFPHHWCLAIRTNNGICRHTYLIRLCCSATRTNQIASGPHSITAHSATPNILGRSSETRVLILVLCRGHLCLGLERAKPRCAFGSHMCPTFRAIRKAGRHTSLAWNFRVAIWADRVSSDPMAEAAYRSTPDILGLKWRLLSTRSKQTGAHINTYY